MWLRQSYLQHCQTRGDDGRSYAHAKQFNSYDGHTLGEVIEATEELTGAESSALTSTRAIGHKTTNPHRVFIFGQKRGVFGAIKREHRRPPLSRDRPHEK